MRRLLACLAVLVLAGCGAASTAPASAPAPPPHRSSVAEGGMCGGFAGFQCDAGLTCEMKVGACLKVADASGVCRKVPEICPMIYQPVCGCDGKSYGSACQAASRGVSVAATGACATG